MSSAESAPPGVATSLALILPLCLVATAILVLIVAVLTRKRPALQMKKRYMKPGAMTNSYFTRTNCVWSVTFSFFFVLDIIRQYEDDKAQEETFSLPRSKLTPPRLLICYSSYDGPAHVKAVMQLGAFIQQHMATKVNMRDRDTFKALALA